MKKPEMHMTKTTSSTAIQTTSVETFVTLVQCGMEMWMRAGEMLVKLVSENPNIYSEIIVRNPSITFEMLLAFEKMGRKQIYPPLLMDTSFGAKKLLDLPYDVQERFSKEPIELFLPANNGSVTTEKKYLKELNRYEADVVFSDTGVRTVEAQRDYMAEHAKRGRKRKIVEPTEKLIGTFVLKISPSGAVTVEKTSAKPSSPKLMLFLKDGVKQCVVQIVENV